MPTQLGVSLRKLRIDQAELLKDMAEKLEMSPAMLSSIENGKRKAQPTFFAKLDRAYALSPEEKERFKKLIADQANQSATIRFDGMSTKDRELAVSFARRFSELDSDQKSEISRVLGLED